MNRSRVWLMSLATLAWSAMVQAADPGFYFAATAGRVEHDIDGRPGLPVGILVLLPGIPSLPPEGSFIGVPIVRPPPGNVFNPFPPPPLSLTLAIPDEQHIDDEDTGFSGTVGYRINRYLAAELTYADLGEATIFERYNLVGVPELPPPFITQRYRIRVRGPSVSVLGSLPLGTQWELFARGGVFFSDQEVDLKVSVGNSLGTNSSSASTDFSDEVVMAGVGVQWSFAPRWAARLEYQRTDDLQYDNTGESRVEQASLSVLFSL
jgi:hypothetical protein